MKEFFKLLKDPRVYTFASIGKPLCFILHHACDILMDIV